MLTPCPTLRPICERQTPLKHRGGGGGNEKKITAGFLRIVKKSNTPRSGGPNHQRTNGAPPTLILAHTLDTVIKYMYLYIM